MNSCTHLDMYLSTIPDSWNEKTLRCSCGFQKRMRAVWEYSLEGTEFQ